MKEMLRSIWGSYRAKLALSIFCVLIAAFDTFWKTLSPIAAGALALAIVPWVIGLIERISAPGGFEVVFSKIERQLQEAETVPDSEDIDAFRYFESSDPNLAIAMLRVQIERRLRKIAEGLFLEVTPKGRPRTLRSLAEELGCRGAIPREAVVLLNDLMPVINEAVHGVDVGENGADFALSYGPKILSLLKSSEMPEVVPVAPVTAPTSRA